MRWLLYGALVIAYAMMLAVRSERAPWMERNAAADLAAVWLPPVGIVVLVAIGWFRRNVTTSAWPLVLAAICVAGCIAFALVPAIQ